jgi:hypothetical protein
MYPLTKHLAAHLRHPHGQLLLRQLLWSGSSWDGCSCWG